MKIAAVALSVLVLSVGVSAQGSVAKGKAASGINATLTNLGCSTSAGTDSFDVQAWSWGASSPVDLSGGGGGTGKVVLSDFNVQKRFDACSPALLGAVTTGKAIQTMTLTQSNQDGTATTVTLTDVRVVAWSASGSVASESASESVSFAFSKVCLTDGASGAKFCYDLKLGKTS